MSNFKKILLLAVSFFVLAYVVLTERYSDVQINKYEDIEVVKENKAIQKGWVPAILPESSYDITETHNIDTNNIFGSFKYKKEDEAALMEHLTAKKDMNNTFEWGDYLFKVDKTLNTVQYRNRPIP